MTRTQILALLIGAGLVAVGAGLAWRGVVPGFAPSHMSVPVTGVPATPMASQTPASKQAAAPTPAEKVEPAKPQEQAAAPTSAEPAPLAAPTVPAFDTVRVEPSGDTVVAGHGEPSAKVALMAGDKVIAEVEADGAGNFVMVPPPLPPGAYVLGLRSTGPGGSAIESHQNVAVSVPAKGQKNVVVALAEPGKPSVILSDTAKGAEDLKPPSVSSPIAAPPPAQPEVAFKTAEVDNGGFYASGTATPGAHLRIYLNGSALADVTAGADGHWSLTVGKGMAPGHFAVRADAIDGSGNVLARAEVPFDVPVTAVAEAAPTPSKPAPRKPAPTPTAPAAATGSEAGTETAAAAPGAAAKETAKASVANAASPTPSAKASVANAASPTPSAKESVANAASPTPSANDAVVAQIDTATVVRGDSLWRISRKVFGHGIRYTLIYEANAKQIRDPKLIYPGQVFVLPHVGG